MEKKTEVPAKRKIAIIGYIEVGGEYRDQLIAHYISDWEWVTEETYKWLLKGLQYYSDGTMRYSLIEYPIQSLTVERVIAYAQKREQDQKDFEANRAKLAADRKKKKKLDKLQLFEKLKKELKK